MDGDELMALVSVRPDPASESRFEKLAAQLSSNDFRAQILEHGSYWKIAEQLAEKAAFNHESPMPSGGSKVVFARVFELDEDDEGEDSMVLPKVVCDFSNGVVQPEAVARDCNLHLKEEASVHLKDGAAIVPLGSLGRDVQWVWCDDGSANLLRLCSVSMFGEKPDIDMQALVSFLEFSTSGPTVDNKAAPDA